LSYLLDTNVVSELRKIGDGKADANVVVWIEAEDAASFLISAITILELERGVLGVQRRDAAQGARLRAWLDNHVRPETQRGRRADRRQCAGPQLDCGDANDALSDEPARG
jgi:predicted nucleic acid-binding protein